MVVFHCLCTIKADSSEVRSTTEDSSRREKGIPRSCGRQPVRHSRHTLLLSCACQQQDYLAGVRRRIEYSTVLGTIQGEVGTCAASAWDCLGNRNVRGQQRWDINNNVNVKCKKTWQSFPFQIMLSSSKHDLDKLAFSDT